MKHNQEAVSAKQSGQGYWELLQLFSRFRQNQLLLLFVCSVSMILHLVLLRYIAKLIDAVALGQALLFDYLLVLGIAVLYFVFEVIQAVKWHGLRVKVKNYMILYMSELMMYKNYTWFRKQTNGGINSTILNDGVMIAEHAGIGFLMGILNVAHVIILWLYLTYLEFRVGIAVFIVALVYLVVVKRINSKIRQLSRQERGEHAALVQLLLDCSRGIRDFKVFNVVNAYYNTLKNHVSGVYIKVQMALSQVKMLNQSISVIMSIIFPVGLIIVYSTLVATPSMQVGNIFLIFSLSRQLCEPLNNIVDYIEARERVMGVAERVFVFLEQDNSRSVSIPLFGEQPSTNSSFMTLAFDLQTVRYDDKTITLGIKGQVKLGEMLLLKGASGTGKTTIVNAILGLVPYQGTVVFQDDKQQLFEGFKAVNAAVVFQDTFIYKGSLQENVCFGREFSQEDVVKALKLANFPVENRESIAYCLGEDGANLSGGERRRLGLARALVRQPQLLILDEVTSEIDDITKRLIYRVIVDYMRSRPAAILAISHDSIFDDIAKQVINLS